jgi:hypothetical protein
VPVWTPNFLVAGGDATRRLGHHRHDADRLAAQLGPELLLATGKEAVHIDEEITERIMMSEHGRNSWEGEAPAEP